MTGHVLLVWDGSIPSGLHYVEPRRARFLECLFPMIGRAYVAAGQHFGPYKRANPGGWTDRDIAGKVMA
ncbi:hypothetical protein ABH995_000887 [Bradyrhizobium yuanmingense]